MPAGHTPGVILKKLPAKASPQRVPYLEALRQTRRAAQSAFRIRDAVCRSEIEMIKKMHYEGYFLIVWDFIHYARAQEVPVGPGRGSAAGSLVSYALRITDVDPLQYNLLFERFLNPERVSMPDIDIDFCMRRRGELIDYVTQKYGRENVSQIITFGTMAAKAAVKDVGRAMDIPYGEVDRLAKLIPTTLGIELDDALKESPQLKAAVDSRRAHKDLMKVALRLEGLARHASTHAAGVVISPQPLTELVPVYKTNRDEITTQYDMNALERIGLLKMDFLGLTTLTVLHDAVKMVEKNRGVKIDIDNLLLDDEATYKLFSRGDTTAIFQFESHGMRDILAPLPAHAHRRPYRPERAVPPRPDSGRHDRRFHQSQARQNQSQLRTSAAAGNSRRNLRRHPVSGTGDADRQPTGQLLSRRSRPPAPRHGQKEKGRNGRATRQIHGRLRQKQNQREESRAHFQPDGRICGLRLQQIALLRLRAAGLSDRLPENALPGGIHGRACSPPKPATQKKQVKYINEARGMSISILPPNVNESDLYFTPVGDAIRFGMAAIKNVGENTAKAIRESRLAEGEFKIALRFLRTHRAPLLEQACF